MDIKTIKELNQKIWYRFLKVVYFLSLIYVIVASLIFITDEFLDADYVVFRLVSWILCPIFIYIGFEVIRRLFFYIVLGTLKPSDDKYFTKLKKYKKLIIAISIILVIALIYGIWEANQVDRRYRERNSSVIIPKKVPPSLEEIWGIEERPSLEEIFKTP